MKGFKMFNRKITLSAIGTAFILSTTASFAMAGPHDGNDRKGQRMGQESSFVYLLKQADGNKDFKITKEEFSAHHDGLFTAMDADKDGSLTPKEMRDYRKAKHEEYRAANPRTEKAEGKEHNKSENGKKAERDEKRPNKGDGKHADNGKKNKKGGNKWMRLADTDGNGQISREEMKAASDKMFDRHDRNKDGVISLDDMPNRSGL